MKPMPDGAVRLYACREVSSAKLRPDDQVGARLARAIFITRREIARCNRRSPLQTLLKFSLPYHAYRKHCEDGDHYTCLREELPMSRVERQVVLGWDLDLTGKHAFSKRAATFIS